MRRTTTVLLVSVFSCSFPEPERTNPDDPQSTADFDHDGVPNNRDCDPRDAAKGEPVCGDGLACAYEVCDDGTSNRNGYDYERACNGQCNGYAPHCGDGVLETDFEACDDGEANSDTSPNACRANCQPARCGDGVTDDGEQCDGGGRCAVDCILRPQVVAGARHTCALKPGGFVSCWGAGISSSFDCNGTTTWECGQSRPPAEQFAQLTAGETDTCGIVLGTRAIDCWGGSNGAHVPPNGSFVHIDIALADGPAGCGATLEGTIECWGASFANPQTQPGDAVEVAVGVDHACARRSDGSVACWNTSSGNQEFVPSTGSFAQITASSSYTCGVLMPDADGRQFVKCWQFGGADLSGAAIEIEGIEAEQVVASTTSFCALHAGAVTCFDSDGTGLEGVQLPTVCKQGAPYGDYCEPYSEFDSLGIGPAHGCGVGRDDVVRCFGKDDAQQTSDVPTDFLCPPGVGEVCGDGYVCGSEYCDDGPFNSTSYGKHCNAECMYWAPYCGDGWIDTGVETCDEGILHTDGCDRTTCTVTAGWTCDTTAEPTACYKVIYVDQDASGADDGTSWANAYTSLAVALDNAQPGHELWVSGGAPYKPHTSDPSVFMVLNGASLYGGFAGTESNRGERDPIANATIISGDLAGDDGVPATWAAGTRDDNSDALLATFGAGNPYRFLVIDGFTFRGAHDSGSPASGAIHDQKGFIEVRNCRFEDNFRRGGGAAINTGDAVIYDSVFAGNRDTTGGAVESSDAPFNGHGEVHIVRSTFIDNVSGCPESGEGDCAGEANAFGSAYSAYGGNPKIYNSRFYHNTTLGIAANAYGGAILFEGGLQERMRIVNTIFDSNQGGTLVVRPASDCTDYSCTLDVVNATYVENQDNGSGFEGNKVYAGASGTLWSSVLWDSSDGVVTHALVGGGSGSNCGIETAFNEPPFVDANGADDIFGTLDDDLHLTSTSSCIDIGSYVLFYEQDAHDLDGDGDRGERVDSDIDGNPRQLGSGVDAGAYEIQ